MENLIPHDDVNDRIQIIRNQAVILDCDVATLYGVETRVINQAVKNNPEKFPDGYIFELNFNEFEGIRSNLLIGSSEQPENQEHLRSKILIANYGRTRVMPKAFTERGLYMLATILKSPRATQTTLDIVDAFAKLRELSRNIAALSSAEEPEVVEAEVVERTGGLLSDLLFSGLPPTSAETSVEMNLGVMKLKRTVKSGRDDDYATLQNEIQELKKMIKDLSNTSESAKPSPPCQ